MTGLLQELRYAVRSLVRAAGFTIVAVLTLALGIGANTTLFSMLDAVLLRPLPFHEQDRVVEILGTGFTFIGSAVVMLFIACMAAYIPFRRAARTDPLVALRYE